MKNFMPSFYGIFSNNSSPSATVMENFHDYTMIFLTMIITFILILITRIMTTKFTNYNFKENILLEMVWTVLPMIILFLIAYPSVYYLYLFDMSMNPSISVKVFGAQWFWIYESFEENQSNSYSSYMLSDLESISGSMYKMGWRLLDTDTRMVIPYGTEIQCMITSMDVIHSFSIPELGIKMDAVPGRLNSVNFEVLKPGTYFGQCSEICGTGHSFMPICLEAV